MSDFIKNLPDPVGIIGMGLSGQAAVQLLGLLAPNKTILTFDNKPGLAQWHDLDKMLIEAKPATLIVSPGVPLGSPAINKARQEGLFITSELDLAHSCLAGEKIIAVTGSIGKSTTTALLEVAAQAEDKSSLAAGNIGKPLASYIHEVLTGLRPRAKWLALELSSYQLENFSQLRADISIITFFSPNHLERYLNLEEYYQTKWRLCDQTRGPVFINSLSSDLASWSEKRASSQIVRCSPLDSDLLPLHLGSAQLLGNHNQQNLALAGKVALFFGWGASALAALVGFKGLPHRLENLGKKNGVLFVNDSKATALNSVLGGAESLFPQLKPGGTLHLLLGGKDKNLPWSWLAQLNKFPELKITYFGECRNKALAGVGITGPSFPSLGSAMKDLCSRVHDGDIVLLSPGGTSHDEFKSFEERGEFFKSWVRNQFSE